MYFDEFELGASIVIPPVVIDKEDMVAFAKKYIYRDIKRKLLFVIRNLSKFWNWLVVNIFKMIIMLLLI